MSKGYIVVQLFTARQARPITNATVIISPAGYGRGKRHPHGAGGQRRKNRADRS